MTARERLDDILAHLPRRDGDESNEWRDQVGNRFSVNDHRDPDGLPSLGEVSTSGRLAIGVYHGHVSLHFYDGTSVGTSNSIIIAPDGTVISAPPLWWEMGLMTVPTADHRPNDETDARLYLGSEIASGLRSRGIRCEFDNDQDDGELYVDMDGFSFRFRMSNLEATEPE